VQQKLANEAWGLRGGLEGDLGLLPRLDYYSLVPRQLPTARSGLLRDEVLAGERLTVGGNWRFTARRICWRLDGCDHVSARSGTGT